MLNGLGNYEKAKYLSSKFKDVLVATKNEQVIEFCKAKRKSKFQRLFNF